MIETCFISQRHVLYHIDMCCVTQTGCVKECDSMCQRVRQHVSKSAVRDMFQTPSVTEWDTMCQRVSKRHHVSKSGVSCYVIQACRQHVSQSGVSWHTDRRTRQSGASCHTDTQKGCVTEWGVMLCNTDMSWNVISPWLSVCMHPVSKNGEIIVLILTSIQGVVGGQCHSESDVYLHRPSDLAAGVCMCVCVGAFGCACVWVCGSVGVHVGRNYNFICIYIHIRM